MSASFFRGAALGMAKITSPTPVVTDMAKYDEITFCPDANSGGFIIDKVWGVNGKITEEDLKLTARMDSTLKWTPNTYLMAEFNGALSGGNIPGINSNIIKWLIYRYDVKAQILTPIGTVTDMSISRWIDYAAVKNNTYQYWIFAVTEEQLMSAAIITNSVTHDYFGWFLIDRERNTTYAFNLNQAGGAISQGEEFVEHNTNSRYHVFSRGRANYLEGSVSAIVADNCSADTQSLELIESLREFILSDREKVIKDNKGRVFKAFVSGYKDNDVAPYSDGDFKIIDFSFKESGVA